MIPLGMGLEGAAWATLASQGFSLVLSFLWFLSPRASVRLELRPSRHFLADLGSTLSVGISAMAIPVLSMTQAAIIFRAVRAWGKPKDIAVIGAAIRVYQLIFVPIWGASQALQPVAATNYGAGKRERVHRAWLVFSLASTLLAVLLWLPVTAFPRPILPGSCAEANGRRRALYLRLYLSSFPFYGFMMMSLTLFQSTMRE
jgi:Na+-driven multidrug efflux pump